MLALTALSLVPRFLLGFLLVEFLWRAQNKSRVLQLFLAGPLGVGISSLLSFLWIWAGVDLRLYALLESIVILSIFAVWAWQRRRSLAAAWQDVRNARPHGGLTWPVALGAAALIFSAQFWAISWQQPHGSWDAWVHWNVVSRFVYRGGEQWQGTFQRILDQPDYPLLLAMTNATTWELVQTETTRAPMALAFLSSITLAGLLFGFVRELRGSAQACLAAIVMLTQPLLVTNGTSQYADIPEACYFLASAGMALLYLRSRDRSLAVLAGLMAGLGAWAKNEGLVFVVTSLVAWAYLSWRGRVPAIKDFLFGTAIPLGVLGLFKVFLAPTGDVFSNVPASLAALADPARYLDVLRAVGIAFWSNPDGAAALVLVLALYALLIRGTRQSLAGLPYLVFMFAAQAAVYILVLVATPFAYGTTAMIPTSIGRLYTHVMPLLVMAAFLWLKSPDELDLPVHSGGRAPAGDR